MICMRTSAVLLLLVHIYCAQSCHSTLYLYCIAQQCYM